MTVIFPDYRHTESLRDYTDALRFSWVLLITVDFINMLNPFWHPWVLMIPAIFNDHHDSLSFFSIFDF